MKKYRIKYAIAYTIFTIILLGGVHIMKYIVFHNIFSDTITAIISIICIVYPFICLFLVVSILASKIFNEWLDN